MEDATKKYLHMWIKDRDAAYTKAKRMKCEYQETITKDGYLVTSFRVQTKKGLASGVYAQSENRIFVHGVIGKGSLKGLMSILTKKFKTDKVTFTPLINDEIKKSVRGEVKTCGKDDPANPYGEDFEYVECEWVQ